MPTAAPIQNNNNAGEISPLLEGRTDLRPYKNGLKTCLNFIPLAQGAITRRPGTIFVNTPKYGNAKACRLERFEYSTVQAYILEIGDLYFRFYRNEGRLENPVGTAVEVATPYPEAEVFNVRGCQSADTLYLTHKTYSQRKLIRNSSVSWTLTQIDFLDGPYLAVNSTPTTLTLSGVSGSVTVTASGTAGINTAGFVSTDVGRLIRFKDPAGNWTWLKITAFTSTTVVTALIRGANASAGTATTNWRLGVWSDTTGYPTCATFFGDRLYFSGCPSYADRIDGSNVSDYENFAPSNAAGVVADNKDRKSVV